ncbi:MAG: 2-hydroxyacid dehydrogenase [Canibacter sp.]
MSEIVVSIADQPLLEALGEVAGVRFVAWDLKTPAPEKHIDIVVPPYWGGARSLKNLESVSTKLVQWQSIGYDPVSKYLPAGHTVANAKTVHETSTAELALGLMLAGQRGIDGFIRAGSACTWFGNSRPSLADRNVTIVGYGGVGRAVDARLQGFETLVTRVASTARDEIAPFGEETRVHGIDELDKILPKTEILVITVPLTDHTHHLVDADKLALLPDDALVVNVARGKVIDQDALVAETRSGRLRAALDVMTPEPLPKDHPLWSIENVLITPHVGGDSTAMLPRVKALIHRQIEHLKQGEPFENVVIEP